MKRIDKIISEQTYYTRSEIKKLISHKLVYANGELVKKPEDKYDETSITLKINGEKIDVRKQVYLLLNKPKGYVSTTDKETDCTVLDLVPEKYKNRNLRHFWTGMQVTRSVRRNDKSRNDRYAS